MPNGDILVPKFCAAYPELAFLLKLFEEAFLLQFL